MPMMMKDMELDSALGLDEAKKTPENLMGGKDNEGGGYDVDTRRLQKAIAAGDGTTAHSIFKEWVIECMKEQREGNYDDTD